MNDERVPTLSGAIHVLEQLDPSSATGPDELPTRILRECATSLALPLLLLGCQILRTGCWPALWLMHWIVPLYKKNAVFKPGNYRGIHLTTVLSKLAAKVIGGQLVPFLRATAFGENQWGFSTGLSAKDLVTMLVMSWILNVCMDSKTGAYLSDISGAFDKVFTPYMLAKLYAAGISSKYLGVIASYLAPRRGRVVVQEAASKDVVLDHMLFQETVLGPTLWNVFFADVGEAARSTGGRETMFADDLNML